jgi:thiamine-monophosphate kinase
MIDISDGLASEIRHLCRESGLGCEVAASSIPLSEELCFWAEANGCSPVEAALESGEEYELLFTTDAGSLDSVREGLAALNCTVSVIGRMTGSGDGVFLKHGERKHPLVTAGWDHFRA